MVAFVRQGPRSSGIRGRSFFNVLSDTISYLKGLDLSPKIDTPDWRSLLSSEREAIGNDTEGDAIRRARAQAAHAASGGIGASALSDMGLAFEEMLLHSQTMVVMHVELVGHDLLVSSDAVSRATQDFFADAPFSIGGKRLRDLVSALSWRSAVEHAGVALSRCTGVGCVPG